MKTRIKLVLYTILMVGGLQAQQRTPHSISAYSFINTEDSKLIKPGKDYYFDMFYDKLSDLMFKGTGKLKIMHIGASHVQAGVWSWTLRNAFENVSNLSKTAPGFMFPFSIAKTNHPYFYKSSYRGNWRYQRITDRNGGVYPIGLSGITGICGDNICSFSFTFTSAAKIEQRAIQKVTVFHAKNDSSYIVKILPEDNVRRTHRDFKEGKTVFFLHESMDTLSFEARKTGINPSREFQLYGVLTENSEPGVELFSIGINGANTSSYLHTALFEEHFNSLQPDLVILSIGVNDASGYQFSESRYTNNYDELISKIRSQAPSVAVLLTTNTDFYFRRTRLSPHASKVLNSMLTNAKKYDAAVWDVHRMMGGNRSINLWLSNKLAQRDRVHFTEAGYKLIGTELFNAIMYDYEEYLYRQLRK